MMVYSRAKKGTGGEREHVSRRKIGRTHMLPVERWAPCGGCRGQKQVDGEGYVEKKEKKQKDIIRSHIGRRSCTLRDRTGNDAGVPQLPGTTRRRQDKCACKRARMAVVALVAEEREETTMMTMKRRLSVFSSVLNLTFAKFAKSGPV